MRMKFQITPRDISRGVARDCSKCPAAIAIRRGLRLKPGILLEVAGYGITLHHGTAGERLLFRSDCPMRLQKWIANFDEWDRVADEVRPKPLAFTLNIPRKVLAIVARQA